MRSDTDEIICRTIGKDLPTPIRQHPVQPHEAVFDTLDVRHAHSPQDAEHSPTLSNYLERRGSGRQAATVTGSGSVLNFGEHAPFNLS
jgi:hypothetical protein